MLTLKKRARRRDRERKKKLDDFDLWSCCQWSCAQFLREQDASLGSGRRTAPRQLRSGCLVWIPVQKAVFVRTAHPKATHFVPSRRRAWLRCVGAKVGRFFTPTKPAAGAVQVAGSRDRRYPQQESPVRTGLLNLCPSGLHGYGNHCASDNFLKSVRAAVTKIWTESTTKVCLPRNCCLSCYLKAL